MIQTTTRPDRIWPEAWTELEKPLKENKNKNGHSKSQNLRIPEIWKEFIVLIQVMKSTKTSSRM